jgi:hypothetical protein
MPDINTDLLLSLDVYNDNSEIDSGWVRIDRTDRSSGLFAAAYQKGDQIVIAFRGWDDLDPNDVDDIIRAYDGKPFQQIREAQQFVDKILAENPGATVTLTGHSLGGALAGIMAVRNNLHAETFAQIESVGAAFNSMDGYNFDPFGVSLWKIPPADFNQDITKAELSDYFDVTNRVVFGDIATYNDRTVPLTDQIGVDSVYAQVIENGILEDDSQFGRHLNITGTAFTGIVPAEETVAPYSEAFATAIHALGFHALAIAFKTQMDPLWIALPRLAFQLTNDFLATEADGDRGGVPGYSMTFDALDTIMLDHLNTPAADKTVAEAMIQDWKDIAGAGENSISQNNADVNTALLQLSIQYGAAQSLGDNPPLHSKGIIQVFGDYLQAGLDGSPRWSSDINPEGAHLIRSFADESLGRTATLEGNQVNSAAFLLTEAADGQAATILSTTAGADIIFGGSGGDTLGGAERGDVLFGMGGGDTENGGAGNDVLLGGASSDTLRGNTGADVLNGGKGSDDLVGGLGLDSFVFTNLRNGTEGDIVVDFTVGDDQFDLAQGAFAGIGAKGQLDADAFHEGAAAADAKDRIIYDSATGALYFDADGNGSIDAVRFATLSTGLGLGASDFTII